MHNMPITYFIYTQTANQPGNYFLGALYEKTEKVVFVKVAFSNSISQLNLDWTSTLCGCQKRSTLLEDWLWSLEVFLKILF